MRTAESERGSESIDTDMRCVMMSMDKGECESSEGASYKKVLGAYYSVLCPDIPYACTTQL
jgi:hypothetical protein